MSKEDKDCFERLKTLGLSILRITNEPKSKAPSKDDYDYIDTKDNKSFYKNLVNLQIIDKDGEIVDVDNWRQVLCSSYEPQVPIIWRDKKYATQDHAIYAMRFIDNNPEFAAKFSLESKSEFCTASAIKWAKAAASEKGKYKKGGQVIWTRDKDIIPDEMITTEYTETYMENFNNMVESIMYSRFYHDALSRAVLLLTRFAILIGGDCDKNSKYKPNIPLMNVRERLRVGDQVIAYMG